MTLERVLFLLLAGVSCASALAVVLTQNVVRMAFWLVVCLGSVAGLFFLLHADFLGAAQLLIYVGGTVVVLIFGVMLTATGSAATMQTAATDRLMATAIAASLFALLAGTVFAAPWDDITSRQRGSVNLSGAASNTADARAADRSRQLGQSVRPLGWALLGLRPDLTPAAQARGSSYLLPFEIVSVHLLAVLIGAAYLARSKRRLDAGALSDGTTPDRANHLTDTSLSALGEGAPRGATAGATGGPSSSSSGAVA